MPITMLPEISAMQSVAMTVADLTPAERQRVALWLVEYAKDVDATPDVAGDPSDTEGTATERPAAADEVVASEPAMPATCAELLDVVAPRTGAQKAVVAGWWLQSQEGQSSWKAYEANKLLKAAGVKVSSISIVLTNAVKTANPMVEELERLGDGERSRKTFRLTDAGVAYVEQALAR